jgi:ribonuclease HI
LRKNFIGVKKQKYYVVWKGRKPGVFSTWVDCSAQVTGYPDAEYKSFNTFREARTAYQANYANYAGKHKTSLTQAQLRAYGQPIVPSYCVDAACSGNPGDLEYRCVDPKTGKVIFHQGPFAHGTNNIGEFLAIVHALAWMKKHKITFPIYSDSRNAIQWVRAKKCKTNLTRDAKNHELFDLIARAEDWLAKNTFTTKIIKWETEAWGEIPADFGRK